MDREILFRGKTTVKEGRREFNDMWVMGDLITSQGKFYIHPKANVVNVENELGKIICMHEVIPETVGQWTGFYDANGRMIFEGDIVLINDAGPGTVGFCKYSFWRLYNEHIGPYWSHRLCDELRYEIIGNIHDNSALLEAVDRERN